MRWSPSHGAWLRRHWAGWAEDPVAGDDVDPEQLDIALRLIEEFLASWSCARCGGVARAESHFVALDVIGEPTVYCVQLPSFEAVHSSGGQGRAKHWGSPYGCHAVEATVIEERVPGLDVNGVIGGFVYGLPFTADEMLTAEWCSRCSEAASRMLEKTVGEDFSREAAQRRVKELLRSIEFYI